MIPATQLTPGSLFASGAYKIVRPLDAGGMGAVYVAHQRATGHERALKLMRAQLSSDPKMRKLFEQEARIGSQIESDHVVQVVDAGVDEATGLPWLAMELLKGQDLARRLRGNQTLPLAEFRVLFSQLGHALSAAHSKQIVHRDLKPENIFLAEPRQKGLPFFAKILDFGIAKIAADSMTAETRGMGTAEWMAPEQSDGGHGVTPAADVWALGLIAFRALTGYHYHRAANLSPIPLMPVLREATLDPLAAASERAKEYGVAERLPAGFDDWFGRCVVRKVRDRYATALEALRALEAVLDGQQLPPAPREPWSGPDIAVTPIGQGDARIGEATGALHSGVRSPSGSKSLSGRGGAPSLASLPPKTPQPLGPLFAAGAAVLLLVGAGAWMGGRLLDQHSYMLCRDGSTGSPAHIDRRLRACQSSCEQGSLSSCMRRGELLVAHPSARPNAGTEARAVFQQLCARANGDACFRLARLLASGEAGAEKDERQAAAVFGQVCSQHGRSEACVEQGRLLLRLDEPQGVQLLTQSCERSIKEACESLNAHRKDLAASCDPKERCVELGKEAAQKGLSEVSLLAYERGCDKHSGEGCYLAAQLWREPRKEEPRAVARERDACKFGWQPACPPPPPPKPCCAFKQVSIDELLERCDRGMHESCRGAADYFISRRRCDLAVMYMNAGCSRGDRSACQRLEGVRKNEEQGVSPPCR